MPSTATSRLAGLETSVAIKAPCRVATTGPVTLSGLQTIDGVTVAAGDRVLVKDMVSAADNGIYNAATGAWVRALDFNGTRDVVGGTVVTVSSGSTNAGTSWRVDGTGVLTPGTDALAFEPTGFASDLSEPGGSLLIGFIQAFTGAIARTVMSRLSDQTHLFDFIPFAKQVTILAGTSTDDHTAYLQAAIDVLAGDYTDVGDTVDGETHGGATLRLPRGKINLSGPVYVKRGVALWGQGMDPYSSYRGATCFVATAASACLVFGQYTGGPYLSGATFVGGGGRSGNFTLNGANTSTRMMYVGRCNSTTFEGIAYVNCAAGDYALRVNGAQNNQFPNSVWFNNRGGALIVGGGAGTNRISNFEMRGNAINGGYQIAFLKANFATGTPNNGESGVVTTSSVLLHGLAEDSGAGADGILYHDEDIPYTTLTECKLVENAIDKPLIRGKGGRVLINGGEYKRNTGSSEPLFDLGEFGEAASGRLVSIGGPIQIATAGSIVRFRGSNYEMFWPDFQGINATLGISSGSIYHGSSTAGRLISQRRWRLHVLDEFQQSGGTMALSGPDVAARFTVRGATYPSGNAPFEIDTTANLTKFQRDMWASFFTGSGSTRTIAIDGTAGAIRFGANNTVGIVSGTGSPEGVVTASPASLYLNLSGGASTTLYVKQTGNGNTGWVGK